MKVEVILDKSQRTEKYSSADLLAHAGIPTYIDTKHQIAHNKIIIIDTKRVLTGSFNFTKNAEEPEKPVDDLRLEDVVCRESLGGLLKHYERRAA